MQGFDIFNKPARKWSDDMSMMLYSSIGEIDYDYIKKRFIDDYLKKNIRHIEKFLMWKLEHIVHLIDLEQGLHY